MDAGDVGDSFVADTEKLQASKVQIKHTELNLLHKEDRSAMANSVQATSLRVNLPKLQLPVFYGISKSFGTCSAPMLMNRTYQRSLNSII